jgi:hypothetical protein
MKIDGDAKLICGALVKARSEMAATVSKDKKGNFGMYATLAAIVEASSPAFAAHGLAVMQEVGMDEHGVVISTWLVHESGATMQFESLPMPLADRKPQAVGSAITYGRRYALAAICGLAPDDDDGQAAQDTYKPQAAPQRAVAPVKVQSATPLPSAPPSAMWDAEPDEKDKALIRLDELGSTHYGVSWTMVKQRNVELVSKGRTFSPEGLTLEEVNKLSDGIVKLMNDKQRAANGTPVAA